MKSDIAIMTVSWIRTPEESDVVLSTIEHLSRAGAPLVVVDAGSAPEHQQKIRSFPHVVFSENRGGLTHQLIEAHKIASQHGDYLFYTHSDKLDFARDTVAPMIETYRTFAAKGMLVPVRGRKTMATYLPYQREQEEFINRFMGAYIGVPNDYYAGPKIYPAALTAYLEHLQGEIGWGIEAFLYVIAKRLGIPFAFFPFEMRAPMDIDDVETTNRYRLRITAWQIEGYLQALTLNPLPAAGLS